jgi:purine-binding chemotaxis protein CheW
MGIVVDSISNLITLTSEQIKLAHKIDSVLDTDYLIGLGTLDERMQILMDLEELMSSNEMCLIEKITA